MDSARSTSREVAQDHAGGVSVEQAWQDGSLKQVVATVRLEIQHGLGELAEHRLRQPWVEGRKQPRDLGVLPFECGLLHAWSAEVVVSQLHEHRCDLSGIVDQHDEIEQRDL
jgi:hypothetical protein